MSASFAASHGVRFALSYLSGTSKDWGYSRLHDFINHKIPVGFVWESAATRAEYGCSAGRSDAFSASGELSRLGVGGAKFALAVDTDTSAGSVWSYFQCAANAVGKSRVGVYGSYRVTRGLLPGVVGWAWQTLAWSYGARNSAACLYQANIDRPFYGYQIDPDYVFCSNNGLYPSKPPAPPNAPGCTSYSTSKSYCYGRFLNVKFYNPTKNGWCSKGCNERAVLQRYDYHRTHKGFAAAIKVDRAQLAFLDGRLQYLIHHRSVAINGRYYVYGREHNEFNRAYRGPTILRYSWAGYDF